MTDVEAKAIADGSWRNRRHLTPGTACGCFHCLQTFPAEDVSAWADDGLTALCPFCGIDSVLPGVTDPETLRVVHDDRFGRASQPSGTEWNAIAARPRRASGR